MNQIRIAFNKLLDGVRLVDSNQYIDLKFSDDFISSRIIFCFNWDDGITESTPNKAAQAGGSFEIG
jgi:hypothetical protein